MGFLSGLSRSCAGLALLAGLSGAALAQIAPTPHALPPLPGDDGGIAFAINNRGEAAGVSVGVADSAMAVKWSSKGEATALLPLPGDSQSIAYAINLRGETAGDSGDDVASPDPTTRAVRWDKAGAPHVLLPLAGDEITHAHDINNKGEVVGRSGSSAVIWDSAGQPRVLPPLPGDSATEVFAINNRGMAAGTSSGKPVVWSRTGVPRALNMTGPGACPEVPIVAGMTWRGEVVGTLLNDDGHCAVVRWNRAGEAEFLELPSQDDGTGFVDYWDSRAWAIDPSGEVAGETRVGVGGVWDRSGDFIALPPPADHEGTYGYAINNRGDIAGVAFGPGAVSGERAFKPVVWR